MTEIRVRYQWGRSEYLRVLRRAALPWVLRRQYILGIFIFATGVVVNIRGTIGDAAFLYIFGLVITSYMLLIMRISSAKAWSKGIGVRGPIEIVLTDDGVSTTFDDGGTTFGWSVFPRLKEWSEYYFLMRNRMIVGTIIPKSAFVSVSDCGRRSKTRHLQRSKSEQFRTL